MEPTGDVFAAVAMVPANAAPMTNAVTTLKFFIAGILPKDAEIILLDTFEFI
jgi:hypothetical protein